MLNQVKEFSNKTERQNPKKMYVYCVLYLEYVSKTCVNLIWYLIFNWSQIDKILLMYDLNKGFR